MSSIRYPNERDASREEALFWLNDLVQNAITVAVTMWSETPNRRTRVASDKGRLEHSRAIKNDTGEHIEGVYGIGEADVDLTGGDAVARYVFRDSDIQGPELRVELNGGGVLTIAAGFPLPASAAGGEA